MITQSSKYWIRRGRRHLVLALLALAATALVYRLTPPPDVRHRLSMGSAYAALLFLAGSLWLGPWNVLRCRPNPVSFDLRRDIGIWAGVLAIFHTAVGLTVHLRGRMWMYFFRGLHPLKIQNTQFGLANYSGLLAALLFLLLLAISNDVSLCALGRSRWKYWQRYTYLAFALTILHGIAYQLIEKRHLPWVVISGVMVSAAIVIQALALFKRRSARAPERGMRDSIVHAAQGTDADLE